MGVSINGNGLRPVMVMGCARAIACGTGLNCLTFYKSESPADNNRLFLGQPADMQRPSMLLKLSLNITNEQPLM